MIVTTVRNLLHVPTMDYRNYINCNLMSTWEVIPPGVRNQPLKCGGRPGAWPWSGLWDTLRSGGSGQTQRG